ncbi:MAG: zinc-binding dehydrogenase [Beutenbergiaceae bacterium]
MNERPTMDAVVLREVGTPMGVEQLRMPVPSTGEVLIEVAACGVCHTDLHVIEGGIGFPLPAVMGHEVSGRVLELGPGTQHAGVEVGDAVVGAFIMPCGQCRDCARGRDDLCEVFFVQNRLGGNLLDGSSRLASPAGERISMYSMAGLAQYVVLPVTALAALPDGMDVEAAAVLGCAGLTAYGAVRHAADLRSGESVAVIAVGGVGSNLVQIAAALGARTVIAVDVDDDKLAAVADLGASATVNSRTSDAHAAVMELTQGRGVDVAFEVLGHPDTFRQAVELLAPGGRMVPVGLSSAGTTASIEINHLVRRSLRIVPNYGGRTRADLPAVIDLAATGRLRYREVVSRRFSLAQADDAFAALARGEVRGRALVIP